MIDYMAAVYSRLVADVELQGMSASVFEAETYSQDTIGNAPVVLIDAAHDQQRDPTYTEEYRYVSLRVRVYTKPEGNTVPLDQAAERIYEIFRDWPREAVEGGELIHAEATPPVQSPTDDETLSGRIVSVRLFIEES